MIVYVVHRNSDTTEGKGPMVLDKIFQFLSDANNYVDDQPGVQGRRAQWSKETYGDWTVTPVEALNIYVSPQPITFQITVTASTKEEAERLIRTGRFDKLERLP